MLTVGSLFSGIGGIDLGLERAGMKVLWQVEIDAWCRAVLAKHWPDVERFEDVRSVGSHNLLPVDLIAGGFPCQDLSFAGRGRGLAGPRSGLWFEYARLIRELRPRYVIVENVPGLMARGVDVVLGDLAACGYDSEWDCIPAAAVGAPHRRDRVWIVAYPNNHRRLDGQAQEHPAEAGVDALGQPVAGRPDVADSDQERLQERRLYEVGRQEVSDSPRRGWGHQTLVADAPSGGREDAPQTLGRGEVVAIAERDRLEEPRNRSLQRERSANTAPDTGWWAVEPDLGRVAHGVPNRVDRLRGLGNAVVPQVVEWIGRRIVEAEKEAIEL